MLIETLQKIIKPVAFIIGIFLVVCLGLMWIALVGGMFWGMPFSSFLHPASPLLTTLGVVNFLIFIGIPLLMIILAVMRIFMRTNFKPRWAVGLWVFWLVNLVSLMFVAMTSVKEFSSGSDVSQGVTSGFTNADTLYIDLEKSPSENVLIRFGDELFLSGDQLISGSVNLNIEKSENGQFEILQNNFSRGRSMEESQQLGSSINYQYTVNGNRLTIPASFTIPKGTKWRGQQVNLTLRIPVGKWVKINSQHGDVYHTLRHVERDENYSFPYYGEDYIWQMGPDGMIAPDFIREKQKDYSFEGFSKIRLEGPIKLNIRRGNLFTIKLENGKEYEDEINVSQSGSDLSISTNADPDRPIVFTITMPTLEEVLAVNSDDVEIRDFDLEKLRIVNEGEAQIKAFVNVKHLDIELTGDNELDLRGEGNFLKVILTDDARMDAEHFNVKVADIEALNNSWIKVSATDTLRQQVENSEVISKRNPVVISNEL